MLKLKRAVSLLTRQPIRYFVNDKFLKDRDDAAEKVFISRQESMLNVIQRSR